MTRLPFRLLFTLLLVFPLAACDSDGDGDGDGSTTGTFSATLGGDLGGSFNGNAFFSIVENADLPGGRAFVLFMTDADLTPSTTSLSEAVIFVRPGDRPDTGTFDLDDPESGIELGTFGLYIDFVDQTSGRFLSGNAGSFTITSSSAERVEGTFNFSGALLDLSNPEVEGTGSVNGSFNATFIDSSDAPNVPTLP